METADHRDGLDARDPFFFKANCNFDSNLGLMVLYSHPDPSEGISWCFYTSSIKGVFQIAGKS